MKEYEINQAIRRTLISLEKIHNINTIKRRNKMVRLKYELNYFLGEKFFIEQRKANK